MDKSLFKKNRKKLMNNLENNSMVILFSGNAPVKSEDENYQFTPNRNFYYFTGIDEEDLILLMIKLENEVSEYLFIKEIDEEKERWVGKSIRDYEAKEISDIINVDTINNFDNFINKKLKAYSDFNIYLDFSKSHNDVLTKEKIMAKKLLELYPYIRIKNIYPSIIPLRLVKEKEEIENIQRAIDITIKGVENIMVNAKPEMMEYELEAYFEFACRKAGVKDYAFKTIAASGKNATILHYVNNNSRCKADDLVLFDLGAQYNYYNGDITRVFPISGKFTERQKQVYNAVLSVNKRVISVIKPGLKYLDLNKMARKWIAEECIKLGLIESEEEVGKYYWHSIGHSLGLDTHDIDRMDRNTIFEEGMVWTVEPGIYIEEEGIGIRIEDDIVVTKDGANVLTKDMIKEIDEIEKFMEKRGK